MMMQSNGNIVRVTDHLCGNSPVTGEFSAQRPVPRSFDVFFDLLLGKRLSKQWWGWWFETPLRPSWRHYDVIFVCCIRYHPMQYQHKAVHTFRICTDDCNLLFITPLVAGILLTKKQVQFIDALHQNEKPREIFIEWAICFCGWKYYFLCVLSCISEEA